MSLLAKSKGEVTYKELTTVHKWSLFLLISMGASIIYAAMYLKNVFYDPLMQALGATNADLGLMVSAYGIAAMTVSYTHLDVYKRQRAGIFRIRIPFIHFKISPPEIVTGLMNACTSYGALAVLITTLGLDPEVAWALVVFETAMYMSLIHI